MKSLFTITLLQLCLLLSLSVQLNAQDICPSGTQGVNVFPIDFDVDDENMPLLEGTVIESNDPVISNQPYANLFGAGMGIVFEIDPSSDNPLTLYDSEGTGGADSDLERQSGNSNTSWEAGNIPNANLGLLAILNEEDPTITNGIIQNPNDDGDGGTVVTMSSMPLTDFNVDLVDIESASAGSFRFQNTFTGQSIDIPFSAFLSSSSTVFSLPGVAYADGSANRFNNINVANINTYANDIGSPLLPALSSFNRITVISTTSFAIGGICIKKAEVDFGDLPNDDYCTTLASNGAVHVVTPSTLKIGATVDAEADGQPTNDAEGDDSNGDDEDGLIFFPAMPAPGGTLSFNNFPVTNMTGVKATLYVFIDFDADGDFDADEFAAIPVPNNATEVDFDIDVPNDAQQNAPVYARFRLTTDELVPDNPTDGQVNGGSKGPATNGEVEDFFSTFVLPVELMEFSAKAVECEIVLNWASASEIDFSHYELQRGFDGKSFEPIAKINGSSNALAYNEYSFTDKLEKPTQYYRLKMVDLDASYEYSSVQVVKTACDGVKSDLMVHPSPVAKSQFLTVSFYAAKENSELTITDMNGKIVSIVNASNLNQGTNRLQIDISSMTAGVYFIIDEQLNTQRFVVIE
ncbi:MAG: T9SS type A sorting domain-containing protein [Bacteroidota bacterium]